MNYFQGIVTVLKREWLLSIRKRSQMLNPLLFFIVVCVLFPLATTPDPAFLKRIGPGVIWVAALLATLLALNKLFQEDHHDGSLEQYVLSPYPLSLLVFAKVVSHWLLLGLPLVLLSPVLALMFHLSPHAMWILFVSLLIGTPILSLVGAIGAALTVGLRNSGLLLALVILPLFIPVMIFGTSAVIEADMGLMVNGQLALMAALLILALTLTPMVSAFALRVGVAYDQ